MLNSFSFSSALEKDDHLDRLGSKLVIYQPTILTDFDFANKSMQRIAVRESPVLLLGEITVRP